ncbi:MAG: hypothetical protein OQK73_12750 [Gammaproteobacteria bacterium]|nr:hypothetical protein [Gammaproteobacteria bacterium]
MFNFISGGTESYDRFLPVDDSSRVENKVRTIKGFNTRLSCIIVKLERIIETRKKRRFISAVMKAGDEINRFTNDKITDYVKQSHNKNNIAAIFAGLKQIYVNAEIKLDNTDVWMAYLMSKSYAINVKNSDSMFYITALAAVILSLDKIPVHVVSLQNSRLHKYKQACLPISSVVGVTTGWIDKQTALDSRREEYRQGICFCHASELVFDYLRDRLVLDDMPQSLRLQAEYLYTEKPRMQGLVLTGMHVALLDRMDEILVDAANTPLEITRADQELNNETSSTPQTVARISYLSFFRRYMQLSGHGNLDELVQEFCYFYRVSVINSREKQAVNPTIPETRLFLTRVEKYRAIIELVHNYKDNHRVLNILTRSDRVIEELISQLHECNIIFNVVRTEQDWLQADTQSVNINLILATGELSSIVLPGTCLIADYVTRSESHKLVSQVMQYNNGSMGRDLYYYISVEDDKISEHRQDSTLLSFLWWCLKPGLKDQKIGPLKRFFLNLINQINSERRMKQRRALLEYETKKGKLLSFTGHQ